MVQPEARADLTVPVLLWEAPTVEPTDSQLMGATDSGRRHQDRPNKLEPLVLPLRKGLSRSNAFGMGLTVGRTENNDLVLADTSVSRFHAYFLEDARRKIWRLVDAESKNGTFVGGVKLQPSLQVELQDRAKLRFGEVELTYLLPESFFQYLASLSPARK
jgi:hypothetical protein